jgi:hypothetical protein
MIETTNGEYPDDHHGHDDEHGHHHVHDYEPQLEPLSVAEPIKPELLEWYRSQPEVIFDVVQHSHLDYAWYRDREASKMREVEAFVKTVKVDNFTLEQTITAKEFIEGGGKDLKKDLLDMIREGRMELIGHYIQPEVFASPEESTFWNIEHGRKTAEELGGKSPNVGYNPDTFGFPDTLPMMYKHAGINTFIFARGFEQIDTIGALFKWKSPDGSEILGVPMHGSYSNARGLVLEMSEIDPALPDPEREDLERQQYDEQVTYAAIAIRGLMNRFGDRFKQIDIPHFLVMKGDDFTKPDKNLAHILEGVQQKMRDDTGIENFQIRTSSLGNYADLAQRSIKRSRINTYEGELRSGKEMFVLRGTDSTRMPLKQLMHKVDSRIYDAGAAVAQLLLARKYGVISDNEHSTRQQTYSYLHAIEQILPVTSHDTILGCGSDNAYPLPLSLMSGAYETANQTVRNSTAAFANRMDTYGPYRHIERTQSFINLLPENRTALVEVPMQGDIEHASALKGFVTINNREVEIPVQIILKQDIRYAVCALPMAGMSAVNVRLEPVDSPATNHETREFNGTFENEFYTVDVLPNGTLQIIDKHSGTELKGLLFEDQGDRGDEYTFCHIDNDSVRTTADSIASYTVINDGPVFTEIQIDTNLVIPKSLDGEEGAVREVETRSANMTTVPISTKVRLIKGIDRVEFATTVHNTARDHRLRVRFDTPNAIDTVKAKEPYGMTIRSAVPISGGDGWVEPFPIATSHNQGIVTAGDLALFNKGLPEYEAFADDTGTINQVALTLLRSVGYLSRGNLATRPGWAGPGTATPEAQLPGEHTFEYAINLRGQQKNSNVIKQANDYIHKAEDGFENATLNGILNVQSDGAVMSALRPTIDGEAVIARFYNPNSEPTSVSLSGIFEHAVRCDAFGKPLDNIDAHQFEMPTGIVSVRLS